MRKVRLGSPAGGDTGFQSWATRALQTIETASDQDDPFEIFDAYTVTVASGFAPVRTLTPASATATDVANVLATIIMDMKARSTNRAQ